MPCFHPIQAIDRGLKSNGKKDLLLLRKKNGQYAPVKDFHLFLPCGNCVDCRLKRSACWAVRCVHEARYHASNCFITLTYNDEHLPEDGSLVTRHFQLFMKRLRKYCGNGIRFMHCGEYGEKRGRPHYHAILFGYNFPDREFYRRIGGFDYFTSPLLEKFWSVGRGRNRKSLGFVTISDFSFANAAYVARYIMKKVNGKKAEELVETFCPNTETVYFKKHYERVDTSTGETVLLKPEYITMSRRPGLGSKWFDEFNSEVYPSDEVVVLKGNRYVTMPVPKYYDKLLESLDPQLLLSVKDVRAARAKLYQADNTPERLAVRELCKLDSIKRLVRSLD